LNYQVTKLEPDWRTRYFFENVGRAVEWDISEYDVIISEFNSRRHAPANNSDTFKVFESRVQLSDQLWVDFYRRQRPDIRRDHPGEESFTGAKLQDTVILSQIHRPNYSVGNGSRREKVLTEPRMYGRSLTIPPVAPFFRARHRTINIVWLLLLVVWVNETVDRLESRLKPREFAVRKSSDTSGIAENAAVRNTD
jgi:hypothetical protein